MEKSKMIFKNIESLNSVKRLINEANETLEDSSRVTSDSPISEVLSGALGASVGGAASFAALWAGGSVAGLSAAGITSGLAAAGAVVGGGMAAGIAVLAAPVAIFAAAGVGIADHAKYKKLMEEKSSLYNQAVQKQNAIIKLLKNKFEMASERRKHLESINILLQAAIRDLKHDLS